MERHRLRPYRRKLGPQVPGRVGACNLAEPCDPVTSWLLEGDPSIRWQVLRKPRDQARIAREGWGRRLLDRAGPECGWAGLYTPKWTSATYTLLLLRQLGLAPDNRTARAGATRLLDKGLYADNGINFWLPRWRCSETCVTAMVLSIAARFAAPSDDRVENLVCNLLENQMSDGGWNCRRPRGAVHSSLHTTISALEGLLEYEARGGRQAQLSRQARERAHEFLFAHQMFRSHRTGAVIDHGMTRFSFPPQWHYDVLRGLDYLQQAGAPRDKRLEPAIELVRKRRAADGRWPLQNVHPGRCYFRLEEAGEPSRWNTLRALRVLRWWEASSPPASRRDRSPAPGPDASANRA